LRPIFEIIEEIIVEYSSMRKIANKASKKVNEK